MIRVRVIWAVAGIVGIAVLSVGSIIVLSQADYFHQTSSSQPSPVSSSSSALQFTIIESDPPDPMAGINGSYYKGLTAQWPIIRVHQGDTVIITVMNNNSREIHGFAIVHYDDRGFSLAPGQQHTISFVANQAGSFRMYCNVFCAIHPYMQNGELIVNS